MVLFTILAVAAAVRLSAPPDEPVDFKESSPVEIAQAVLHGLACLLCVVAMVRSGRRRADFYWWVAPAFIAFFMFWREAEIDSDLLGLGENAFTWKYLFEGHMPIWKRLVLGVPSTSLAILVLVVCLVPSFEIINTSVESQADFTGDTHELLKRAKDTAAAAVLIMSLCSMAVGGYILLPRLVNFFSAPTVPPQKKRFRGKMPRGVWIHLSSTARLTVVT